MAYQGFTHLGNRELMNDAFLWEEITPTGHSRKEYAPVASTEYSVSPTLKADGTKVAAGEEAQADSVCIVNFYADLQLSYLDRTSRKAETSAPERVRQISFPMMYFKEVESITPDEIQGVRQPGTANELTTEAVVRAKKLMTIRTNSDITREFLFMQALKGKVIDANGVLYADLYKQFDVTKKTIYFDLDNPNSDIEPSRGTIGLR
ncbi:major capsid protein [Shigella phage vB_SflM_004]|nr:major capsid protein [Shigella phage vB_SflM_004]